MDEIKEGLKLLAKYQVNCVIVGGVAAWANGSSQVTFDVDVCYARDAPNLEKLTQALQSVKATLRGAPKDIPFILAAETFQRGLNFTFQTEIGDIDLLGEVRGVGLYSDCLENSVEFEMFGHSFRVIALEKLIAAKRAAGRPKDLLALVELEAILESRQMFEDKATDEKNSD
jgi:predicted nucleotidyltransferase